jgi:hypothetical protein
MSESVIIAASVGRLDIPLNFVTGDDVLAAVVTAFSPRRPIAPLDGPVRGLPPQQNRRESPPVAVRSPRENHIGFGKPSYYQSVTRMLTNWPVLTHIAAGVLATSASGAVCDQPRFRSFRTADESSLIVRALGASVPTSDALPPFVYAEWQPPGQRSGIAGQVVLIEDVLDDPTGILRRAPGREIRAVLVPWDHDTGCEPIPWTHAPIWITPGTVGFVAARLRPRERWAGDYPTFDVRDAWREPYTEERARSLSGLSSSTEVMTPSEFGWFHTALPELSQWERDPKSAIRPLLDWQKANPALAAKAPAHNMIASLRTRARTEQARR